MTIRSIRVGVASVAAIACLALFASDGRAVTNQWTAIGAMGANVHAVAFGGNTVYAGLIPAGVIATDDMSHWRTANEGLTDRDVLALCADPRSTTLYAGTNRGIYKSRDAGLHWTAASQGLPVSDASHQYLPVNALVTDPSSPDVLYAATGNGLYRSTDAATTWTSLGFADSHVSRLAVDPQSSQTLYVVAEGANGPGLYTSTDGGANWTRRQVRSPRYDFVTALALHPRTPGRLYVGLESFGLYTSADGGATWSPLAAPTTSNGPILTFSALAVDAARPDTLYAGTYEGSVFSSSDGGHQWTRISDGTPGTVNALAIRTSPQRDLYIAAANGLFRIADSQDAAAVVDLGLHALATLSVAIDPTASSTVYAGAAGTIMKTTDGGATWSSPGGGQVPDTAFLLAIDPATPARLYAIVGPYYGPSPVYTSGDGGSHWSVVYADEAGDGVQALAIAPSAPGTLVIGVNSRGVLKSTDQGASWTVIDNRAGVVTALAVDPRNADRIYAAHNVPAGLSTSTDGGRHWTDFATDPNVSITGLTVDPAVPNVVYATYSRGDEHGGILRSDDAGTSWSSIGSLPDGPVSSLAIDPMDTRRLYAGTSAGVFRSADAGTTWTPLSAGLPDYGIARLAVDRSGAVLRAATNGGLFEYRFADATAKVVSVVEYHHSGLDHYFITASADEIANLDNGVPAGWKRTGLGFNAYAAPGANTSPVCRFFSTAFASNSSHFYTPFAFECANVRADARWQLETEAAFDVGVPTGDGACAAGWTPVYRLYNNGQGGAPSHRYTTDRGIRAQMIAQGWVAEGLGPDAVQMCSPP